MSRSGGVEVRRNFTSLLTKTAESLESGEGGGAEGGGAGDKVSGGVDDLVGFIAGDVIGSSAVVRTAYGDRLVTFGDWTASARALRSIEDYLAKNVLPLYANTHTTASTTGTQTTLFRAEARGIVRRCVGGDSLLDSVLFTGSGSTGAVNHLVHLLRTSAQWQNSPKPPLVVVGPYEHHSNLLPWRESGARVVHVREAGASEGGGVDLPHLDEVLAAEQSRGDATLIIGAFSAASNVTGILVNTRAVAARVHRAGGLCFFDFATAGPYVEIDMNPRGGGEGEYMDGLVLSPHKFVGGVSTPGVLVIKRELIRGASRSEFGCSRVPLHPGGGTVFFVTPTSHRYLDNLEEREEGGTPDIVGSVRCALALRVKELVTAQAIMGREHSLWVRLRDAALSCPALKILGPTCDSVKRLAILSFSVLCRGAGRDYFLHHNFVAALLNDLFGLQVRSGCMCAGPYALSLLGIEGDLAEAYEEALLMGDELVRPGFVRLSINYFTTEAEMRLITEALAFVAEHGWKLLPCYAFIPDTGEWRHTSERKYQLRNRRWLSDLTAVGGAVGCKQDKISEGKPLTVECVEGYMRVAMSEVDKVQEQVLAGKNVAGVGGGGGEEQAMTSDLGKRLRWFMLGVEAVSELKHGQSTDSTNLEATLSSCTNPFVPIGSVADLVVGRGLGWERFVIGKRGEIERRLPHAEFGEVLRLLGEAWRHLSEQERTKWEQDVIAGGEKVREDAAVSNGINGNQATLLAAEKVDVSVDSIGATAATGGAANTSNDASDGSNRVAKGPGDVSKEASQQQAKQKGQGGKQGKPQVAALKKAEKKLTSLTGRAIFDFSMIKDGDRVLVGLSGGKDSLSMLHILMHLQRKAPIKFDIGACTVDPQTPEYDPRPLTAYLASLGVPYFYESQGIMEQAACSLERNSICSFCSRMKRGVLYSVCKRENYGVLALGQHLDDQAESMLMSAFHNGQMRTMKAHYRAKDHDVRIIRPLNYVREYMTREYAIHKGLPVIDENCPGCFESPKERARVKTVLASQEQVFPDLYGNLLRAMMPLMAAGCADPEAPAVLELKSSIHSGEQALVQFGVGGIEEEDDRKQAKGGERGGAPKQGGNRAPSSGVGGRRVVFGDVDSNSKNVNGTAVPPAGWGLGAACFAAGVFIGMVLTRSR